MHGAMVLHLSEKFIPQKCHQSLQRLLNNQWIKIHSFVWEDKRLSDCNFNDTNIAMRLHIFGPISLVIIIMGGNLETTPFRLKTDNSPSSNDSFAEAKWIGVNLDESGTGGDEGSGRGRKEWAFRVACD